MTPLMVTAFLLGAGTPTGPQRNLVPNPGFEKGEAWQPEHWSRLDRLTSFRALHSNKEKIDPKSLKRSGGPPPSGKYLKINTNILLSQYEARQKELDEDPDAPPPSPLPVKPPGYDTVAGTKGVAVWSDPIPIKQNAYYNLSAWVKGAWLMGDDDFAPKIFVKGYARTGEKGEYKEVVRKYLNCRADKDKGWQWFTWKRPFSPGKLVKNARVEFVRIEIFCYWPRYEYGFDDIRFFEVPPPTGHSRSPLETDGEGKHGTEVSPRGEGWFSPAPSSGEIDGKTDDDTPEGLQQLLDFTR